MRTPLRPALVAWTLIFPASHATAQGPPADSLAQRVDHYLRPYLDLAAFSGAAESPSPVISVVMP